MQTGSNRWACDRCTLLAARLRGDTTDVENDKKVVDNDVTSDKDNDVNNDSGCEEKEKAKPEKKIPTVYSNASKQLLLFSPPAVLTIHLKRFEN